MTYINSVVIALLVIHSAIMHVHHHNNEIVQDLIVEDLIKMRKDIKEMQPADAFTE